MSERSSRALLCELQLEVRRRERLARCAPLLHDLIERVESAWHRPSCSASQAQTLELWLVKLVSLSDAGIEISPKAHDRARRELEALVG